MPRCSNKGDIKVVLKQKKLFFLEDIFFPCKKIGEEMLHESDIYGRISFDWPSLRSFFFNPED